MKTGQTENNKQDRTGRGIVTALPKYEIQR